MLEKRKKAAEILGRFKDWLDEDGIKTLPKSGLGKAMAYAQQQWPKLEVYVQYPQVHIDNNLIENKIRPVALGRKNYLFAGSHPAAQHAAMIYSFLATCKMNAVEPFH